MNVYKPYSNISTAENIKILVIFVAYHFQHRQYVHQHM